MATDNLGLETNFLGGGPTLHDDLSKNFEKIDAALGGASGLKAAAAQANSAATEVSGLVSDFNALLAKLRTAGLLKTT